LDLHQKEDYQVVGVFIVYRKGEFFQLLTLVVVLEYKTPQFDSNQ
jgi:hypothetical protein